MRFCLYPLPEPATEPSLHIARSILPLSRAYRQVRQSGRIGTALHVRQIPRLGTQLDRGERRHDPAADYNGLHLCQQLHKAVLASNALARMEHCATIMVRIRHRCDVIVATPRGGMSNPRRVDRNIFNVLGTQRALPFISGNQRLSRRFRVPGSGCLAIASLNEPQQKVDQRHLCSDAFPAGSS